MVAQKRPPALPERVASPCDMKFLSHKREWKRSNEATPLSSPAPTSPSMMQERERRRANVPTISTTQRLLQFLLLNARAFCWDWFWLLAHPGLAWLLAFFMN